MQRNKRFTTAIIAAGHEESRLRLTFFTTEGLMATQALIDALTHQGELRIGRTQWAITAIDISDPEWAGVRSWADLMTTTSGDRIRLTFMTPTAIMKRDNDGRRFSALYPHPADVFLGLHRRWVALEGPALPSDLDAFLGDHGLVVANYQLRTVTFRSRVRTQIGFTGAVLYECRKNSPAHLAAVHALARLAFYTGVGYQTARGMGTVQPSVIG